MDQLNAYMYCEMPRILSRLKMVVRKALGTNLMYRGILNAPQPFWIENAGQ
jgi:hypothetical protein